MKGRSRALFGSASATLTRTSPLQSASLRLLTSAKCFASTATGMAGHNYLDRETYKQTLRPVEESHSLLPVAYHDPAFYELEKQKIFNKTWVCAGYTTDVPNTGDTKCLEVGGQAIMITRDKQGKLRGYFNVCRHRGSRVVLEDGVTNHKVLTCPYHCWSYTLEGKLLGVSMFNKARRENKIERGDPSLSLLPIQVDTWGPFMFVNLDADNTVPLSNYLGDIVQKYPRYYTSDKGEPVQWQHVKHKSYTVNSNWKNAMENFNDWYHVPWVHRTLAPTSEVSNHIIMQGPGMYAGFGTVPLSKGGSPADADYLPALSTLNEMESKSAVFLHLFPNISLFMLPHHILSLVLTPVSHEVTLESLDLFLPTEMIEGAKDKQQLQEKVDTLFDFWDKVNVEDVVACQHVQTGQKVKGYTGGPFSQFEVMIHRLQKMVVESIVEDGKEKKTFESRYAHFYDLNECKECHHYNNMRH